MKDYGILIVVLIGGLVGFAVSEYRAAKVENRELKSKVQTLEKQLDDARHRSIGSPFGEPPA